MAHIKWNNYSLFIREKKIYMLALVPMIIFSTAGMWLVNLHQPLDDMAVID